jgi:hypothetical protein
MAAGAAATLRFWRCGREIARFGGGRRIDCGKFGNAGVRAARQSALEPCYFTAICLQQGRRRGSISF